MRRYVISSISILAISALAVSCGGDGDSKETTPPPPPPTEETPDTPAETTSEVLEVTIEGNDQMQFNMDLIEASAGQTVRLTLKNVGELPVEQMGHNWTLFAKGVDANAYASEALNHKDNGYQVPGKESDVIAFTSIIGPGESETIEFKAPSAGIYKFACTFPGHVGIMNGKMIVK
ncbi:plastocyanin/azurin family copper-binding protein [Phaeocystidibacter luteus]|uniref:Azurin n=1 Tax=Phaeocystidibacter luteus TaxID=911197 RepID=A0A6N6RMM8_9FLAO|nr:plastocyanin/azurin family copper-binding protein [Phaeocystidibacter luteus]KAB2814802.1 Azurin [Phaeocystidibacter luteus]